MTAGANILIVDDEQAERQTLAELLRRSGHQATEAGSGREALDLLAHQRFDLVILDLKMPEMDGTEVLHAARPLAPDTAFIILTAHGTLDSAMSAIRHGACDYLLKPSPIREILRGVEAGLAERQRRVAQQDPVTLLERALTELRAAAGSPAVEPSPDQILQATSIQADELRKVVVVHGEPVELTSTEFDILAYLLRHRNRVVSARELVRHLRGCELHERDARVVLHAHIHRLRRKLQRPSARVPLIGTVRGRGYRIAAEA